ncbi:RNase adapter RapZ [Calidifontibacter sp. DB0510]|uniref:RNase adapter RapZ n=1 Tax=Metallococcus carri TaxID=1656884 RepID=A0A967E974_9MICO|nr:RNase adapter RapZ [Metallococcus carri]NHN54915.1 RNase adapter RapZ [Metallococcus carri]NOP37261.1 RNase adapter RapZ [Calidifontibacter sp. DB2511S]
MTSEAVRPDPQLVVVTGMSGAGRTTAANVLEDRGWYVIDNLPPQLLGSMAELLQGIPPQERPNLAAVVDVRAGSLFADFREGMDRLRDLGWRTSVVFVDATDEALVRRFESVRRPHPLQGEGRLLDGILAERERLRDLRANADILIDTSGLNVHQLTAKVRQLLGSEGLPELRIAVMSFGFKYGIPLDADLVFDMRFLPNPFWDPALRPFTGQDEVVADFVLGQPGAQEFVDGVLALLEPMTAGYLREGRSYVTLAVGCTGGKHRSVAVAEALADRIGDGDRTRAIVVHRDLGRE